MIAAEVQFQFFAGGRPVFIDECGQDSLMLLDLLDGCVAVVGFPEEQQVEIATVSIKKADNVIVVRLFDQIFVQTVVDLQRFLISPGNLVAVQYFLQHPFIEAPFRQIQPWSSRTTRTSMKASRSC